jgi:hypothetical protein
MKATRDTEVTIAVDVVEVTPSASDPAAHLPDRREAAMNAMKHAEPTTS